MKRIRFFLLGISAASALITTIVSSASEHVIEPSKLTVAASKEEMVLRLIVKPHPTSGAKLAHSLQLHDASALAKTANHGMTVVRPMSGGAHVLKLDQPVTLTEARTIASRLMQDGEIELVEPDRIRRPTGITPTDPSYAGSQWHYFAPAGANKGGANLPNAWAVTTGSASITVAVIDTGYRQHADLATVWQGYDFITDTAVSNDGDGRDADAQDPGDWVAANECGAGEVASNSSWHGTFVMGTVAALMNNGLGGTGIAPGVKILPVRVLGKCGGYTSDIVDGMYWAAGFAVAGVPANAHPANVLNLSLGGGGACSNIEQTAVTQIVNAGKVIIAASGNDGTVSVSAPANCTGVIAVTAHAIDGDNAYYANIGHETAISAPGGGCGLQAYASGCSFGSANGRGIYSLWNSGTQGPGADTYAIAAGTSMAVPHVAGVVALMLSVNSALTPAQIKTYLQTSARAHPAGTTCTQSPYVGLCGAGLLDAAAALTAVNNLPPI
ncbi:MAG: S8 family peptidase, partial [Burkholderiaceae bacterium]